MLYLRRGPKPILTMKLCLFSLVLLVACTPIHHYNYKTSLRSATDKKMSYENDSLRISFYVEPKLIAFRLDNKLSEPIQINWEEAKFMIDKEHHKVMRTEMGVFKAYERQPPTTILPGSYIRDQLVPVRNIKDKQLESDTKVMVIEDMLPQEDKGDKALAAKITHMKGAVMEVNLPIYIRGKSIPRTFYITIDDISKTKTGNKTYFQW
jgi:acetone carboxylase gamma subunit